MRTATKILFTALFCVGFTLGVNAQFPYGGVVVEEVPIDPAVLPTIQATSGFTDPRTWRVYICVDDPNWAVIQLLTDVTAGVLNSTFEVSCPTCTGLNFYQTPSFGEVVGADILPFALGIFPELAYDSWWNIGPPYLDNIDEIGDNALWDDFEAGNAFFADNGLNTVFPPSLPSTACNYTPVGGRVLIGQFTTEGVLEGNLAIRLQHREADAACSPVLPPETFDVYNVFFTNDFTYSFGDATCLDMPSCVDFGNCPDFMGATKINGVCVEVSGCGWVAGGVDYSPFSFATLDDCIASQDFGPGPCYGLPSCIDFGSCPDVLGWTQANNTCIQWSGCGTTVGGIDYSPFFYSNIDECTVACAAILLPVDLLTYTATADVDRVRLRWVTATESNSNEFIVERSTDMENWSHVATKKAAGYSQSQIVYTTYDLNPKPGLMYYRLRQFDLDGSETVNEVRTVTYRGDGPVPYPIPARESLRFRGDMSDVAIVRIVDMHGRAVLDHPHGGAQTAEIDLGLLARGTYILELIQLNGARVRHTIQKM